MNEVKKLKKALCNPEPVRLCLRVLSIPLLLLGSFALFIIVAKWMLTAFFPIYVMGLLVSAGFSVFAVFEIVHTVRQLFYYKTLKQSGRMSWDYLVNNQLEQDAAKEFCGEEKVVCHLNFKGDETNPFGHRENYVTPNFVFIMSDGVVLHHSEIAGTQRQRISFASEKKRVTTLRTEIYALCTHDDTVIPLMSIVCRLHVDNYNSKNDLSHLKKEDVETLEAINRRLRESNPDCKISLNLVHSTVISG